MDRPARPAALGRMAVRCKSPEGRKTTWGWTASLVSGMIQLVPDDSRERLESIRGAFRLGRYEISRHAAGRMLRRGIRTDEIEQAIANAEVIEEYPQDKYGPSLLLLGSTRAGRPLHIQIALARMRIVTVYEPDPSEWSDWRTRRIDHDQ